MELTNEFRVGIPIDQAWSTLTDIEYIVPCMPGAQLTEIDGDDFKGQVKIKVGPITAQYKGTAKFIEKNQDEYRLVIDASGRDSRGAGNASAEVSAHMSPDGDGTRITISTDLKVTGKVAQFGRGVMADVSEKILGQFVDRLEKKLAEEAPVEAVTEPEATKTDEDVPASAEASSGPRRIDMPEPEPVDLLDSVGAPLLKRFAPLLVVVVLLLLWRSRRRS
jgi:carbon monoxide dehydrogenase subunit G